MTVTAAAEEKKDDDRLAAELPNLSDRQIRVYTGPDARSGSHPAPTPNARPARTERCARPPDRGRSRRGGRDPASEGRPSPGEPPIVTFEGRQRRSSLVRFSKQDAESPLKSGPGDRVSTSPRPRCSGTSGSTPPRSTRARTSWPTRPFPPASSSFWTSGREPRSPPRIRHRERPEDRQPGVLRRSERGTPAACRPRSSRSTVFAAIGWTQVPERLAHRVEQPSDERADRHRPRARGGGRPRDRDTARAHCPSPRPSRSRPPQAPSSRSRSSP